MKLLVTGGCGFSGSNFIKYVLEKEKDIEIFNLDAMTYAGQGKNLEHMGLSNHPNYHFEQGDITNYEEVERALKKHSIDAVVNFAAESHVDRGLKNASPFIITNIGGTQVLLEAAINNNVEIFTQISTDEVYGGNIKIPSKETDGLKPSNTYSITKRDAEDFALYYYDTYGLDVRITRGANNYGPYQFPEKFIPLSITNLLEGKAIPIYGSGENIREWTHVLDHCEGIYKVLMSGKLGEIYNIGGGKGIKNIDIAKIILEEMGFGEEKIQFVEDRKGHDLKYSLNCEKIKYEFGWEPAIDFAKGIKETIKWYEENKKWWERLKHEKGFLF